MRPYLRNLVLVQITTAQEIGPPGCGCTGLVDGSGLASAALAGLHPSELPRLILQTTSLPVFPAGRPIIACDDTLID